MADLTFFENLGAALEADRFEKKLGPYIGSNRYTDSNGEDYLMIPLKDIIDVQIDLPTSVYQTYPKITLTYITRYGNEN